MCHDIWADQIIHALVPISKHSALAACMSEGERSEARLRARILLLGSCRGDTTSWPTHDSQKDPKLSLQQSESSRGSTSLLEAAHGQSHGHTEGSVNSFSDIDGYPRDSLLNCFPHQELSKHSQHLEPILIPKMNFAEDRNPHEPNSGGRPLPFGHWSFVTSSTMAPRLRAKPDTHARMQRSSTQLNGPEQTPKSNAQQPTWTRGSSPTNNQGHGTHDGETWYMTVQSCKGRPMRSAASAFEYPAKKPLIYRWRSSKS
ncbi:hypothetical protein H0G86_000356 [Trichoderma simmonsii]|uniref:Uncharacterized protein n=1 Tax=Trichoderma simmonsii TaxID=1491479 RepID=A0A8G0L4F6_9HYPO|nr:hypothetical protein H0G86_000356 [Trichoderma simmonsii]